MYSSLVLNIGKQARPAVIDIFKMVDLAGKDGIVSEFSPGVFLQVISLCPFNIHSVA